MGFRELLVILVLVFLFFGFFARIFPPISSKDKDSSKDEIFLPEKSFGISRRRIGPKLKWLGFGAGVVLVYFSITFLEKFDNSIFEAIIFLIIPATLTSVASLYNKLWILPVLSLYLLIFISESGLPINPIIGIAITVLLFMPFLKSFLYK